MSGTRPGAAEIFRRAGDRFLDRHGERLRAAARQVLHAIRSCRTESMGVRCYHCGHCDAGHVVYNSCRNRHCPNCQGAAAHRWLARQRAKLLPAPYFHLVFTLPRGLARLAICNRRVMFNLLMKCSAETALTIAADPERFGARIGATAVLHTWNQRLEFHPHVHLLVPNGGFDVGTGRWRQGSDTFFAPVKVLSRLFRRLFLERLEEARRNGELEFKGKAAPLESDEAFQSLLAKARGTEWNVYAKPPFKGPDNLLKYLSRYTHRVAIGDSRITAFDGETVWFRFRKPKSKGSDRTEYGVMSLPAVEFIRRFLMHALPSRFHRIRHFGILANSCARKTVAEVAAQTGQAPDPPEDGAEGEGAAVPCPTCQRPMRLVGRMSAWQYAEYLERMREYARAPPMAAAA